MKTTKKLTGLFAFVFVLFIMSVNNIKAQTNCYKFDNNTACSIEFDYELYSGTPCTSCGVVTGQQALPGRFDIPCNGCLPVCGFVITITGVGGTPLSPTITFSSSSTLTTIPATGSCNAFDLTYTTVITAN